jgi:hypothetical protein
MNILRRLTVTQGLVLFGVILTLLIAGIIITSLSRGSGTVDTVIATNTPSINFDNFTLTIEPSTPTPEAN